MTTTTLSLFRKQETLTPDEPAVPTPAAATGLDLDDDRVEQYGYAQALENQADAETFQLLLSKIRTWFEEGCAREQDDRTRSRSLMVHEAETLTDEARQIRDEAIPALRERLAAVEARREAARTDPDSVEKSAGHDPFRQQLLGWTVVVMSAWLFLFYFLAAHVAWLRNLGSELQGRDGATVTALFETVFDLSAVLRDLAARPANLAVCLLFPALFCTIGYLTHLLAEKRRHGWLALSLGITMGLDFAIAYGITMKLHEARFLTGLTDVPWRFGLAFGDVNFYTVLLAGMGTYLLWGLPLSLYLAERRTGRHLDNFLATCASQADALRQELADREAEAARLDGQVQEKQAVVTEIEAVGTPALLSRSRLERLLDAFAAGWAKGVNTICCRQLELFDAAKRETEEEKRRRNADVRSFVTAYKESLRNDPDYRGRRDTGY